MELDEKEFRAMNSPIRRFVQRIVEYPIFRLLGLAEKNKDILEIGCGSGYGASLLSGISPNSYVGVDVMSDQIALAKQSGLAGCDFFVMDVTNLSQLPDKSKDIIVDFGILHHVEDWGRALEECHRVLRGGGRIFLEEPSAAFLRGWDRIFKWNHPLENRFDLAPLEEKLTELGFVIEHRMNLILFGFYAAKKR
jgi:SAM-dependent methyltransferase